MKGIYLDNAATTPLLPEVREFLCRSLDLFGNPSSSHRAGREARELLELARENVASLLGVEPNEVVFNSGATEGNNTIFMNLLGKEGNVVLSPLEHKSVSEAAKRLRDFGIEVRTCRVGREGVVDVESLEELIDERTLLVSVMSVSNEFGTIQPVEDIALLCRERGVPFHTDGVQAIGKVKVDLKEASYATFSGHKFHAPKGVGFMLVREELKPLLVGGGQERGLRSGTENLHGILAMAKALEVIFEGFEENLRKVEEIRNSFEGLLKEKIPGVEFVGEDCARSPYISAVILPEGSGWELVQRLSERGVFCSSGSACVSGETIPNQHLLLMGYSPEKATRMIRFSFGLLNEKEEVLRAADILAELI